MRALNDKQERIIICLIAFFSWLFVGYNIQIGFKSFVDEAFFILGLNPEQNLGIQHSQFFQIVRFLFNIFSVQPTIIHSRIAAYICIVFTLFFFSGASYYWLNTKGKIKNAWGLYVSLVFLWGTTVFFSGYEISFSFNHLLVCFVTLLFSFYLLWDVINKRLIRQICIFASGGFTFLALMNYFPSGILILFVILLLILLKENQNWKNKLLSLFVYLTGVFACAILYNSLIFPVKEALNEIIASMRNPAFGTGGYDLFSYLGLAIDYAGIFMLLLFCGAGIYFFHSINQKQKLLDKPSVAVALFTAVLILAILDRKVFKYSFLIIPIVISCLFYLSESSNIFRQYKKRTGRIIRIILFLFFPVIALIGTNVEFIYKLNYSAFFWIFILAYFLFQIKDRPARKFVLYLTLFVALAVGFGGNLYIYRSLKGNVFSAVHPVENNRMFNHIKLKESQMDYFQKVDSLLNVIGFNPKSDRILAFDYDYATLLYLDATNYGGLMHHIENLPAYKAALSSPANAPDYIIVCETDRGYLKETLDKEEFQWNFPSGYTQYRLGNPEEPHLIGNRRLYVKNL
jgi:hypothetical protein